MDSNVALIVGALIGGLAGVGGAWMTNRANASQQAKERAQAQQLERERWERDDRYRFAAERRVLYAQVIEVADAFGREYDRIRSAIVTAPVGRPAGGGELPQLAALRRAVASVDLIAGPAVVDAARTLSDSGLEVFHKVSILVTGLTPRKEGLRIADRARAAFIASREAFRSAARRELGIDAPSPDLVATAGSDARGDSRPRPDGEPPATHESGP